MRNAKIPGEEEAKECGNKVASSGGVVVVATSESDTWWSGGDELREEKGRGGEDGH